MFFRDWKSRICYNNNEYDDGHYNKLSTGMATSYPLYFILKNPPSRTRAFVQTSAGLLIIVTSLTRFAPISTGYLQWKLYALLTLLLRWVEWFWGSLSTNRVQGPGVPLRIDSTGYPQRNTSTFHAVNFIKADSGSDIWTLNEWGVLSMN